MKELTTNLRHNEQPVWNATAEIHYCFSQIALAIESDINGANVSKLTVYLNELFVLILDMLRNQNVKLNTALSSSQRTVELFLADLHAHPENLAQPWTLASMAKRCDLGVTYFVHHCKQLTNMTPMQYVNQLRVENAARLLLEAPDLTITQIAHACGFASSQYFATTFKRLQGKNPLAYRKQNLV